MMNEIQRRYGISEVSQCGNVLIFPYPVKEGRFGRLRYFTLALMRASSALYREVVQLTMELPTSVTKFSTTGDKTRAPITYPMLCSNVLTHVTAVICSISGTASIPIHHDSRSNYFKQARDASAYFVALGLVAKVLQSLLSHVHPYLEGKPLSSNQKRKKEGDIIALLLKAEQMDDQSSIRDDWLSSCRQLVLQALGHAHLSKNNENWKAEQNCFPTLDEPTFMRDFSEACHSARKNAEQFLRDALLILQLAMTQWSDHIKRTDEKLRRECGSLDTLEQLQRLVGIAPLKELLQSSLVCEIIVGWYNAVKETPFLSSDLNSNFRFCIREIDWPLNKLMIIDHGRYPEKFAKSETSLPEHANTVPLIGLALPSLLRVNTGRPRLHAVPLSYTDLYAQVSVLLPSCDQCAFCFICGQVLNASGSGECTRHSYVCGAGAGIFFLLQECVSILMYKEKATYFHSPYVDSHGETHMSRGRPLNIDIERYETLVGLYSGHLLRQQVISERSKSSRQNIISNYY